MSTANHRHNGGNNAFHNFADGYSHIRDPNLRRRLVLRDIDRVPFGLYHVRAVVVAGVGFFLDSYDIFSINFFMIYLGVVFWQGEPGAATNGFGGNHGHLPSTVNQSLKAATSAGIVIGQVLFGWLADVYGRRRIYGIELGISCDGYGHRRGLPPQFGDNIRIRPDEMARRDGAGSFINVTNLSRCGVDCQTAADRSWRLIVGAGALPACFALYYRITIPETPRYTFDVAQDIEKADADIKAYMASKSTAAWTP
ncbi:hypothetical protein RB601_002732 [Gaeumannomyces tritici]